MALQNYLLWLGNQEEVEEHFSAADILHRFKEVLGPNVTIAVKLISWPWYGLKTTLSYEELQDKHIDTFKYHQVAENPVLIELPPPKDRTLLDRPRELLEQLEYILSMRQGDELKVLEYMLIDGILYCACLEVYTSRTWSHRHVRYLAEKTPEKLYELAQACGVRFVHDTLNHLLVIYGTPRTIETAILSLNAALCKISFTPIVFTNITSQQLEILKEKIDESTAYISIYVTAGLNVSFEAEDTIEGLRLIHQLRQIIDTFASGTRTLTSESRQYLILYADKIKQLTKVTTWEINDTEITAYGSCQRLINGFFGHILHPTNCVDIVYPNDALAAHLACYQYAYKFYHEYLPELLLKNPPFEACTWEHQYPYFRIYGPPEYTGVFSRRIINHFMIKLNSFACCTLYVNQYQNEEMNSYELQRFVADTYGVWISSGTNHFPDYIFHQGKDYSLCVRGQHASDDYPWTLIGYPTDIENLVTQVLKERFAQGRILSGKILHKSSEQEKAILLSLQQDLEPFLILHDILIQDWSTCEFQYYFSEKMTSHLPVLLEAEARRLIKAKK